MIRIAQDDQILKVLNNHLSLGNISKIIMIHQSDTGGAKQPAFAGHYRAASGILLETVSLLFLTAMTAY